MGCGLWSDSSFRSYSSSRGRDVDSDTGILKGNLSVQEMYTQYKLSSELNPLNVVRECCESEEHPNARSYFSSRCNWINGICCY